MVFIHDQSHITMYIVHNPKFFPEKLLPSLNKSNIQILSLFTNHFKRRIHENVCQKICFI